MFEDFELDPGLGGLSLFLWRMQYCPPVKGVDEQPSKWHGWPKTWPLPVVEEEPGRAAGDSRPATCPDESRDDIIMSDNLEVVLDSATKPEYDICGLVETVSLYFPCFAHRKHHRHIQIPETSLVYSKQGKKNF